MKRVTIYYWRYRDQFGKMQTTRYRAREDEFLRLHPDAQRIEYGALTFDEPESPVEVASMGGRTTINYPPAPGMGS